ncbi:MAG: methylated-DNA--[protein]-cysteine S-methyltransferase [Chloroflexota bacterium]
MARSVLNSVQRMHWRSPWGLIPVLVRNGRIRAIALDPRAPLPDLSLPHAAPAPQSIRPGPINTPRDLARLMGAVLRGEVRARDLIAASDLTDCSPFERSVLTALAKVRYGESISYGELAAAIGAPRAARAVGGALGKNPIPLLLPCHRVLAANGIGGYGGGADRTWLPGGKEPLQFKRALLAREGVLVD